MLGRQNEGELGRSKIMILTALVIRLICFTEEHMGRFLLVQVRVDLGDWDDQCGIVKNIPDRSILAVPFTEGMSQHHK
jgi:hypothetical protein